jgi:acyl-CoA thioester hydrolase
MIRNATTIRVRYADTDQMKQAYYGKYFEYFEQGRSDMLRSIGLPYSHIEEMGLYLPVIEAHAEYKRPARYDDEVEVIVTLRDRPVARVRLDYEILRKGDPEPLVTGYTIHGFVNASNGRVTRAPAQFIEAIEKAMEE